MTVIAPVLLVSYYFPPLGLAGTARAVYLANALTAAGYAVTVLTVKPIAYPAYDDSLASRLDQRVRVIRSGSTDPARLQKLLPIVPFEWLKRLRKQSDATPPFPDSKRGFIDPALREARKLATPETIVISTSPPISAHLVARTLKQEFGCIWIADFRDIWSSLPPDDRHSEFRKRADQLLRGIVDTADAVTTTSPLTADHLRGIAEDQAKPVKCIVNGFDESDFDGEVPTASQTFGYYGTINELSGFERVLEMVARWREVSGEDWRINHVGHLSLPELPELLRKHNLVGKVTSTGYLAHAQAVPLIRQPSINLLSLELDRDTRFIVPSRLFELLRSEPPLIAIVPIESAVRRVLRDSLRELAAAVDSKEEFVATMNRLRDHKTQRHPTDRRALVAQFAWPKTLNSFVDVIAELKQ